MSPRAALNAFYAWRVTGLDEKQRREFDEQMYGWRSEQEAANRALMGDDG